MIAIDTYAYTSKLRLIDPKRKLLFSLSVLGICVLANSLIVSLIIIFTLGIFVTTYGGIKKRLYLRMMMIPLTFLVLGIITILIDRSADVTGFLFSFHIGSYYYGITRDSLGMTVLLFAKSMGAISALYFLALTTPIGDILNGLRELKFPKFFLELMDLIYGFIFILLDTADNIHIAQSARLGYSSIKKSYYSLAMLLAHLFDKSYYRANKVNIALEARNYTGDFNLLPIEYEEDNNLFSWGIIFIGVLILVYSIERLVLV